MSLNSTIERTDSTWNPVQGCTKISPGCKHCYAARFAERFRGVKSHPFEFGFDLRLVPRKLLDPLRWSKPRRIFVNSIRDLFHESIPTDYMAAVGRVMAAANWHQFQVLTKCSENMKKVLSKELQFVASKSHILWGVSVEDRKYGLPRLRDLQATPVRHRFLSVEPLLEDLGTVDLEGIDWVIVGGESGPGARTTRYEWVTALRDQCRSQNVPLFFKQWGGPRKKAAGNLLDGKTEAAFPVIITDVAPKREMRMNQIERLTGESWSNLRTGPSS